MPKLHRRFHLAATASVAALGLALTSPASAQTATAVLFDPGTITFSGIIIGIDPDATQNTILNDQASEQDAPEVIVELDTIALSATVGDPPVDFLQDNNTIFARAQINSISNAIGVLPAPGPDGINGGAITSMQTANGDNAFSFVRKSAIEGEILGEGSVAGSFSGNAIAADTSFNRATSTIETVSYDDLVDPPVTGVLVTGLVVLPFQIGSFSVLNTQANVGFDADTPSKKGDSDGPMAWALNNSLVFDRNVDETGGVEIISGSYALDDNSIAARASGNSSDNSVLLRREITYIDDNGTPDDDTDDTEETIIGNALFEGTAVVSNIQLSEDTVEGEVIGDGVGIDSLNDQSEIFFIFRDGGFAKGDAGLADGLNVIATGNEIVASSAINSSRNEVFFDGGISLDGVLEDPVITNVLMLSGIPILVAADYQANNIQLAGVPGETELHQGAKAQTIDGRIILGVEDVGTLDSDDPVAPSVIGLNGNAITAAASGNSAANLIGNGTDKVTPRVDGVSASTNWQYIYEPEIEASVTTSDEDIWTTIAVGVGLDIFNLDDDENNGGFEGGRLELIDNSITASASGNSFQSSTSFSALEIELDIDEGGDENVGGGVALDTEDLSPTDSIDVDAIVVGGATTSSFQVLDLDLDAAEFIDPSIVAGVANADLIAAVNASETNDVGVDQSLDTAVIDVLDNAIAAQATGNSFLGLTTLDAETSLVGSAATQATQLNLGQNVSSSVVEGHVHVWLGTDETDDDDADKLAITIAGNEVLSLATINSATTATTVSGLEVTGGAFDEGENGEVAGSDDSGTLQPGLNDIFAGASFVTVTNQLTGAGDASALLDAGLVELSFGTTPGENIEISDSRIAMTGNTLGAQARGNAAVNQTSVEGLAVTTQAEGALAGIVSQQSSLHTGPTPLGIGPGAIFGAAAVGNVIVANLFELDNSSVAVEGNRIIANAGANQVTNVIGVSALSLEFVSDSDLGADLTTVPTANGDDVDLRMDDAGLYIINSQRNEGVEPDGDLAAGPQVLVLMGANAALEPNAIIVELDEDFDSEVDNSTLSVSGNAIQGTGRANDAVNAIGIAVNTGDASAGILSSQVNSGQVSVGNVLGLIVTDMVQDAENDNPVVTMNGNQIGSTATGNQATNQISATATVGFSDAAPSGGLLNPAAIAAPSGTFLHNGFADAHGNLVILNTQTSYGIPGDGIAPVAYQSSVGEALIALNSAGDSNNGVYTMDGNAIVAGSSANSASNAITASAAVGGLPSATIVNQQSSLGASVQSGVADSTISMTLGGTGRLDGGRVSMSGNAIGASGAVNTGRNTISAPGQSFTRTSTF